MDGLLISLGTHFSTFAINRRTRRIPRRNP